MYMEAKAAEEQGLYIRQWSELHTAYLWLDDFIKLYKEHTYSNWIKAPLTEADRDILEKHFTIRTDFESGI